MTISLTHVQLHFPCPRFTKDAYSACMGSSFSLALTVLKGSMAFVSGVVNIHNCTPMRLDSQKATKELRGTDDSQILMLVHANQTYQNEESKAIIDDQCVSQEKIIIAPGQVKQEKFPVDYITHKRTGQTDNDEDVSNHGHISLFELNSAARQQIPNVFIGITYKDRHTRNPEIMCVEGNHILHIETEKTSSS